MQLTQEEVIIKREHDKKQQLDKGNNTQSTDTWKEVAVLKRWFWEIFLTYSVNFAYQDGRTLCPSEEQY